MKSMLYMSILWKTLIDYKKMNNVTKNVNNNSLII